MDCNDNYKGVLMIAREHKSRIVDQMSKLDKDKLKKFLDNEISSGNLIPFIL